jgi:hypothetical protein
MGEDLRILQERRRARHGPLRDHIESLIGRDPWPVPVVSHRNTRWLVYSPPVSLIIGVMTAGAAIFLLVRGLELRQPVFAVMTVLMGAISLGLLAHGAIRLGWWIRARRIAVPWVRAEGTSLPEDLSWWG